MRSLLQAKNDVLQVLSTPDESMKATVPQVGPDSWWIYFTAIPLFDLATGFLACFMFVFLVDFVFLKGKPGRWFGVHALGNLIVSIASTPALLAWINDPMTSMNVLKYPVSPVWHWNPLYVNNQWSALMVPVIHTYHMVVFWQDLTPTDYFHHFVFVPYISGFGLMMRWGPLRNVLAWSASRHPSFAHSRRFICGVPGGLDYFFLFLMKRGLLDRLTQKRYMCFLNVWIRSPGLILTAATLVSVWNYGECPESFVPVMLLAAVIVFFNGQYGPQPSLPPLHSHMIVSL